MTKPTRSLSPIARTTTDDKAIMAASKKHQQVVASAVTTEATTVISKDKFKALDVSEVKLTAIDYSYSLLSHTEYEV